MTDQETIGGLELLEELGLTREDFNPGDRDFLKAVYEHGEATTSLIRDTATIDRQKVHYRYEKFEDLGLVDVDRVGLEAADGRKSNTVTLTDAGEAVVESGILDEIDGQNLTMGKIKSHFDHLERSHSKQFERERRERRKTQRETTERVEKLGGRVYTLEQRQNRLVKANADERITELEETVTELEERLSGLESGGNEEERTELEGN